MVPPQPPIARPYSHSTDFNTNEKREEKRGHVGEGGRKGKKKNPKTKKKVRSQKINK